MKKLTVFSVCIGSVVATVNSHAMDLKQSKVTQVVNDVQIISAADQNEKAATVNDIFSMPDILRTGASSRAELVADDQTVTRVGANTIFSFDPANRTIDLKQGSLLFHSPHGKGGGAIHTGSATASVLGTTLIVVTTPNGGLKVIALEGQVEVKFSNGLKQKLDPGQMTYVLPGANQLAPVIIFRLDELTRDSLLVKGFTHPLDSMSLIQNQIDKQDKSIKSKKLTDTGLLAGDSATPTQVEVLDPNTISGNQQQTPQIKVQQQPPPPSSAPPPPQLVFNADAAESADATINQSLLTDVSIPTPPLHIYTGSSIGIPGVTTLTGQSFDGFIAKDIYFNTPAAGLDPLVVDLSPYSGLATFDFVAVDNIDLDGSVTFKGFPADKDVNLIAGGELDLAPGITVEADAKQFLFSTPSTLTLDGVTVENMDKDISLNSGADINLLDNTQVTANGKVIVNSTTDLSLTDSTLTSGDSTLLTSLDGNIYLNNALVNATTHAILIAPDSINLQNSEINSQNVTLSGTAGANISLNNVTINAPGSIVAVSASDIDITGTSDEETDAKPVGHAESDGGNGSVLNTDPATGNISLVSTAGSIKICNTSMSAQVLTLNSGDGILLNGNGQTFAASGPNSQANLTALNGTAKVCNTDLSQYATVNIAANTINLRNVNFSGAVSLYSLLGVWNNGSVVPGDVNDLGNVTYDNVPVDVETGSSGQVTSGIYVGTLSSIGSPIGANPSGAFPSANFVSTRNAPNNLLASKGMDLSSIHRP